MRILFALKKLAAFSEVQRQIPACLSSHAFYFCYNRPLSRTREFYLLLQYIVFISRTSLSFSIPALKHVHCGVSNLEIAKHVADFSFIAGPVFSLSNLYFEQNSTGLEPPPPPPSPLTISLFYLPYQRLGLIYLRSYACGLDLLEITPFHDID